LVIGKLELQKTARASHGVRGEDVIQSAHTEGQQISLTHEEERAFTENFMEKVCSRANLNHAYKRVKANDGSAGIDKMTTSDLLGWLKANKENLVASLLNGSFEPQPVKGVKIPKAGGGARQLGVPTVVDRLVQQAILQILEPILDPTFSEASFGFRPKRSAHQALQAASGHVKGGNNIVVDLDLEKFFDRVNHDILMSRLAKRVGDKRLLKIVRKFLTAGMMENGVILQREEGTPQGGPLSPLLANLLLDDLDKELERRGHKFCRYADDCNIYVQSQRAGERVMESVKMFLETKLKLKVNAQKSAVARTHERKFLGYRILDEGRLTIAPASLARAKKRIKEITNRNRGIKLESVIEEINEFTRGWVAYFKLAEAQRNLKIMDGWIRRRLRCYRLKQCKRLGTAVRFLLHLGVPAHIAKAITLTSRWWRASSTPAAKMGMSNQWFQELGLLNLEDWYFALRSR
jgi:RNA-directed DNA polymerase